MVIGFGEGVGRERRYITYLQVQGTQFGIRQCLVKMVGIWSVRWCCDFS